LEEKERPMTSYEKLPANPGAREAEVLAFWKEHGTFERSLEQTRGGPRYVFYEGPPTANGRPHFGHLIPRVYKDLFPRYKTMQGYYVGRKGGWDAHGLPVELEVEKAIGVNSKPEIEAYGVERFVERCKESVWKYKADWERMMERMGFWVDLENAYVTYTDDYIETLWWELRQMYDRGLLYRGHKVLPYCPRCGTGLSSHEVAQGYRTTEDPSITVRMRIAPGGTARFRPDVPEKTSLLVWTTTPWTLPANLAVAVAAGETYVEVEAKGERLILARARLAEVLHGDHEVVREIPGEELVGLAYEPPYRLVDHPCAYRAYAADFVTTAEGTGIVHTAPAFGEDDYRLGQTVGLPFFHPVDLAGRFTEEFPLCTGVFVKEADAAIIGDLKRRGVLYRSALHTHEYPFCWRCDTPLLYYAMDSWYIRTTAVKEELIAENERIRWYPGHVGEGRLGDFLENLKDWALSRDRYWGTPLNLWICEACGDVACVGSRAELVERALDKGLAASVELHRPYVDRVLLKCAACGAQARRVSNVIDAWFDSGSMHTAQWHYPFENEEQFRESFPADFICEAMEQTRGWFYTLLATSTILHGGTAFRNCIATGLGLDESGLKMSKSKGNVIDPWTLIEPYGADCIRWYLLSSSAPWKSKRLGEADVKEPLYRFLDTLRNTYDFFALYASIDGYAPRARSDEKALALLDRWVLSRLASTTKAVTFSLDVYDAMAATGAVEAFVDDLSNWYVRLSRRRFWRGGMGEDKRAAYATLRRALSDLVRLAAPFVPFISESVHQRLRTAEDPDSVHLCAYPVPDEARIDTALETEMALARSIVSLGHQARNQAQVKVRQPLRAATVAGTTPDGSFSLTEPVLDLVRVELNLEGVEVAPTLDALLEPVPAPNFKSLGPRLGPLAPRAAAWIKGQPGRGLWAELARGAVAADLGGERVEIRQEDVSFATSLPEGFVLVEEGGIRFLLDARLDEGLREKGLVRELVHRIQNLRKEAGFEVTDRITVRYLGDAGLEGVLAQHAEFISSEVLAVRIERASPEGEFAGEVVLDEGRIGFGLSRVRGA
jgi:isoleucyl-tRNA synthetase